MTLSEALEKVNATEKSGEKTEEQRRMAAFLLANSDYLKYLFDLLFANIPPVVLTMFCKMLPKGMEKENWYRLPISGVYSLNEEQFQQLFDMIASMIDYARKTENNEHHAKAE